MSPPQVMGLIALLAVLAAACVSIVVALTASRMGPPVKAAVIGGVLAIVAAVWGSVVPIVIIGGGDEQSPTSTPGVPSVSTRTSTPTPTSIPALTPALTPTLTPAPTPTATLSPCGPTPIGLVETVSGSLSVTDCWSTQQGVNYYADRYSFTASAGQQVSISVSESFSGSPRLYLIGPAGAPVDSGYTQIPSGSGFLTLTGSGTYIIEVTSDYKEKTGSYTLEVSDRTGGCGPPTPVGLVDTVSGSLSATDCWSTQRGVNYYADRYSFTASAGQQVSISVSESFSGSPRLYLIGPAGAPVDSGYTQIPSGSGFLTLTGSGTYIIEVTSDYKEKTGSYTLTTSQP